MRFNEISGVNEVVIADECTYEWWVDSYNTMDTVGIQLNGYTEVGNVEIDDIGLPTAYIEVGCDFNPTPDNLVAAFDLPGNPPPSGDATNTVGDINVVENNEGIP